MIGADDRRRFHDRVARGDRFALVTHMNPDGDALGSEYGLARYLLALGKQVVIVNHDPPPPVLGFLERDDVPHEIYDPVVHDRLLASRDRIFLLDNSAPDRLGRLEDRLRALSDRVTCIDHHPTRGTVWGELILDVGASAAAAMVHELVTDAGWRPDPAAAEALFVGIATDTGFFRFNSTNARAMHIAADLVECGVRPSRCYRLIYERNSAEYTRMLGRALSGLRTDAGGEVVSVTIPSDAAGTDDLDTSEMTTPLLAIENVKVALLFRELHTGKVKVSLRSKGAVDVHALAVGFGGGGHRNASGIVATGALADVVERVIAAAVALVEGEEAAG